MDDPTMRLAEDELDAAFAERVEADRRRHASLEKIRTAILAACGRGDARRDVERTRMTESKEVTGEPPKLP